MKNQLKGFISGVFVTLLVVGIIGTAAATVGTETATLVYSNIRVTLDGKELSLKNANGATVEPFIIGGTTYLPVRGIANAFDLDVTWDAASSTVVLSSKKPVTFYSDYPSVPDFGAYAKIPCAEKTTKGPIRLYTYKVADIIDASSDTERLFSDYFTLLINAGFAPSGIDENTHTIHFGSTRIDEPITITMEPIGVEYYGITISRLDQITSSSQTTSSSPSEEGTNAAKITIYITPTGKRYHLDSHCNGGTYIPSTLDYALRHGLTPCQKCGYR